MREKRNSRPWPCEQDRLKCGQKEKRVPLSKNHRVLRIHDLHNLATARNLDKFFHFSISLYGQILFILLVMSNI